MLIVVQVAGALLLGALLGVLMFGDTGRQTIAGLTALAVAVAGLAFWAGVWSMGRTFVEQVGTYPSIHEANIAPASLFPVDENLLNPVESAIPRNGRVYLICLSSSVGCSGEWISYQLSPRLFVSHIQEAEYVLVYGASPTTVATTAHLPLVLDLSDGGVVRAKKA